MTGTGASSNRQHSGSTHQTRFLKEETGFCLTIREKPGFYTRLPQNT